ncbi:hypothetical protein C0995_008763 [Termitomyces sp. Mi166|nr:hypothetical protein C0995_008763 [Termitomyces sp. Mi166\
MSLATISISYELNPPAQIVKEAQGLTSPSEAKLETYYGGLRVGIAKAKDQLGKELTEWRDAVGKAELSKERPKTRGEEEEEEGGE